jgi:hypothetical protein
MADLTFYSAVAQAIPVRFLTVAIDRRGFAQSATEKVIVQLLIKESLSLAKS